MNRLSAPTSAVEALVFRILRDSVQERGETLLGSGEPRFVEILAFDGGVLTPGLALALEHCPSFFPNPDHPAREVARNLGGGV